MRNIIFTAIATHKINLVFHESNERRDNNCDAFAYHCRQLITQTFTTTCWLYNKSVAAGKQRFYDFFLVAFERIKTKMFLELFVKIRPIAIGCLFCWLFTICSLNCFFCGCGSHYLFLFIFLKKYICLRYRKY